MANVVNVWDRIKIYCLNHDEPKEMVILTNTDVIKTQFYRCSDEHCPNRLNLDDYQGLILKFLNIINDSNTDVFDYTDFTNYTFSYKGARQKINAKVISYSDKGEIALGIINTTVLGGKM